ncbi:MAG TPA: HAD-IA family hydrolase [Steroidobacteraceae bacterium]
MTTPAAGAPPAVGALANVRGVVFDFDLTLADSATAVVECANSALSKLGMKTADFEAIKRTIGLPLPLTFRALTGVSDPALEKEFATLFVQRADEVMLEQVTIYEGVPVMCARLRRAGMRLAIVSTKFRYRIESILAKASLAGTFDVIVGGEDVKEHKPHPEGLLCALERLDVPPTEALYVGDHPLDAETAARAGTSFIAVRSGSRPPETWENASDVSVIERAAGLADLLRVA